VQVLKDADMVLAINGEPVSSYTDVERIIAQATAAAGIEGAAGGADGHGQEPQKAAVQALEAAQQAQEQTGAQPPLQQQQDEQPAMKRAKVSEAGGTLPHGTGQEQLPEVRLTVFRAGEVQDVSVRQARSTVDAGRHSPCLLWLYVVDDPFFLGYLVRKRIRPSSLQVGVGGRVGHQSSSALVWRSVPGVYADELAGHPHPQPSRQQGHPVFLPHLGCPAFEAPAP
jgi:hypothetical protein